MTAPCDPESAPERQEEEQEIVLRLGDILPRVPGHLLKPGPHEARSTIRFSVDELAEKISRGRASVPLERLAAACPEVFRESSGFPGEQEIQLPLQKLLEQVGLVAPKGASPNGVPKEQVAQARAQAGRIIEAGPAVAAVAAGPLVATGTLAGPAVVGPATETNGGTGAEAAAPQPAQPVQSEQPVQPARMAKAISAARQILGMLSRATAFDTQVVTEEKHVEEKPVLEEKSVLTEAEDKSVETAPVVEPAVASQTVAEPALVAKPAQEKATPAELTVQAAAVPAGCISVRALPIFRLLPSEVVKAGTRPSEAVRAVLPLAMIDSQLAGGHVEIPLEDFIKALPEELRGALHEVPGTKVWIPLDEIFQSLPADHLFHMPAMGSEGEKESPAAESAAKESPALPVTAEEKAVVAATTEIVAEVEVAGEVAGEGTKETKRTEGTERGSVSEGAAAPAAAESGRVSQESHAMEVAPGVEGAAKSVAEAGSGNAAQGPARAAWMRGFQVPPPRLFSGSVGTGEAVAEVVAAEPVPQAAPTPEAKRTADFLANQNGVFAAAAFVQGAVFASEDFPRKPDLDALRDFMGSFVDQARESGQRLGWNRVLTIACEDFYATAVVRETHFIVALHYDRVLPTLAHDALISAADDLSKVG